jgi:hypothetical protein
MHASTDFHVEADEQQVVQQQIRQRMTAVVTWGENKII